MADTLTGPAHEAPDTVPEFPMPRDSRCPFDPPPALKALQGQGPLTKVRLWDGSEPWLVTRYAEQRALLGDARVSADTDQPGYPTKASPEAGEGKLSFIMMDDPEHARLRRMVTGPFAVRKVEALRPAVQRIVDGLIDDMLGGPAAEWEPERLALRTLDDLAGLDLDLRRGVAATGLQLVGGAVELADGSTLPYDGLILATGVRPRRLPGAGGHVLRTLDDALRLRDRLTPGRRLVVVGAGFLGPRRPRSPGGSAARLRSSNPRPCRWRTPSARRSARC